METTFIKQKPMVLPKVKHNFLYHAEIMYETKDGFDYKSAVGNTLRSLLNDIDIRLKQLANRNPKIIQVLYKPQRKSINITAKVLAMRKMKPYYSSN